MTRFIEGQKVVVTGNTVCHGLEIGSVHKIDDIHQQRNGHFLAVIGRWYIPFDNIKEEESK